MFANRHSTPLETRLSRYMSQVFLLMALGSLLTAAVVNILENIGDLSAMHALATSPWLFVLIALQLSFVFAVIPRIPVLGATSAGVILAETIVANSLIIIPVSYALFMASPMQGLFVATFLFLLMALFSRLFTRHFGIVPTFAIMGLFGWAFAMFLHLYFGDQLAFYGDAFNRYIVSLVAVVTVAGFTAWHGQQIKLLNMAPNQPFCTTVLRGTALMALDYVYLVVRIPYQVFAEIMDLLGAEAPHHASIPKNLSLKALAAPVSAPTKPVVKKAATRGKRIGKKSIRRKS